jgi:hypothetical protein
MEERIPDVVPGRELSMLLVCNVRPGLIDPPDGVLRFFEMLLAGSSKGESGKSSGKNLLACSSDSNTRSLGRDSRMEMTVSSCVSTVEICKVGA